MSPWTAQWDPVGHMRLAASMFYMRGLDYLYWVFGHVGRKKWREFTDKLVEWLLQIALGDTDSGTLNSVVPLVKIKISTDIKLCMSMFWNLWEFTNFYKTSTYIVTYVLNHVF